MATTEVKRQSIAKTRERIAKMSWDPMYYQPGGEAPDAVQVPAQREGLSRVFVEDVGDFDFQIEFSTIFGRITMTQGAIIIFSDSQEAAASMAAEGGEEA